MKKLMQTLVVLLSSLVPCMAQTSGLPAPGIIYTNLTTWQSITPYPIGAVVLYHGIVYQSLIVSNTNNNPLSSPSDWSGTIGGGATSPATSLVLVGNGSANGIVAGTPGVNYVIPSGNITGNAATATSLAVTPTLCSTGQAPTGILPNGNATGCAAISAAVFPGSNGIVFNTSTTASRNAVTGDIQTVIGSGVYDASGAAAAAQAAAETADQAFSSNAANITSGTINSGRIPTLNQNTSGNAATATTLAANPTTCSTGQAPTGVLASGAATGCATILNSFSSGSLSPLFTASVATSTSTPALTFVQQTAAANTLFGNFTGSSAVPTFSATPVFSAALLTGFPTFNQNTTGTAANLSGTPALPNGTTCTTQSPGNNTGDCASTAFVTAAITASGGGNVTASGTPTSGQIAVWTGASSIQGVTGSGTGVPVLVTGATLINPALGTPSAIVLTNATGFPTLNQNTTGTAANVTGVVAIANGGTGAATQAANTVFSNSTGSTAAPTWTAAPVFSAALLTGFPTFNQSTTGTASNLSGTPALPNGTTATTQTTGDATTKLATDAAVMADIAIVVPATSAVLVGSGTAGSAIAGTAGVNYIAPNGTANLGVTTVIAQGTAILGTNDSSDNFAIVGSYWNGTVAAADQYTIQNIVGTGTNPATTLTLTHTGTAGVFGVTFGAMPLTVGNLTDSALTSGMCVQASTSGLLSTTTTACNSNVNGNTFPASAAFTSGGIPYFSSTSVMSSSALLTHYGVIYGGGAGASPVATAADTTTSHALFATATAPAFRALLSSDVPTLNQNTTGTAANLLACTPSTAGSVCYWNGTSWTLLAGNASGTLYLQENATGVPSWTAPSFTASFSGLTGSTNTSAAMLVGTGASLGVTGSGTINATTLGGATFASPGTIGGTTPGTGFFTTLVTSGPTQVGSIGTAISGTNYNSNIFSLAGSYWNGTSAAPDGYGCQDIVTAGTNPFTLLNCYHTGSGSGEFQFDNILNLTAGFNSFSSNSQNFSTDVQPTFYPGSYSNYFNDVFYADAFASNPLYPGVGQATIAYSSSVDAGVGQSVSYSGAYYLAMATPNHTTTPGTNLNIWWPIPQTGATTPLDLAWYEAEAYKHNNHLNALVMVGAGIHYTNGLVDLVDGSSYDDENAVSLIGCGDKCAYIQYSGAAATPMINRPTGGANFASMTVRGMTLDGNTHASSIIEAGSLGQSYFENFSAGNVVGGADHVLEFGHFGGDAFQVFVTNINIGIYPDNGTMNCGVFTANVVGGSITSYTVNNGGNCYYNYGSSPNELTVAFVQGFKGGTSNHPCTVMPVGQVVTVVGTAVTAISEGSNTGGSGCSGTIDVQVYQTTATNYGAIFNNSDSTIKDIVSYSGAIAAFNTLGMGDGTAIHLHPSVTPNGVMTLGGLHLIGTEIDDVAGYGIQFQNPYPGEGAPVVGTNTYIGGNRFLPGSHTYEWTYAPSINDPVNISASGSLCSANPGGGIPTDWQEFVMPAGTINTPADYLAKAGSGGLSVLGNDTSCSEGMGDFTGTLTVSTLNIGSISSQSILNASTATATSGTNYSSSGNFGAQGSYWNGTSAVTTTASITMAVGTGTNPNLGAIFQIYPCPATCSITFNQQINASILNVNHLDGSSYPAASVAAGAGAGTSPTVSLIGYSGDLNGYIAVTPGASPTPSATIATLTFGTAYNYPGPHCVSWPANAATNALVGVASAFIPYSGENTTSFTLTQGSTALTASTPYLWGYTCIN